MAHIIQNPNSKIEKCGKCKSIISYEEKDIISEGTCDYCYYCYITCPNCNYKISVPNNSDW
jgi:MinD superfamily P-loop ATPase